jgi:hypothetical protein
MQPTQSGHGFTHHSRVKKKDYQKQKHIETLYNLISKWWWKGFLEFERIVEDPIEDIGYTIMKYTICGYGLHLGASMLIRTKHAHLCE